jgi:hypothetical protein
MRCPSKFFDQKLAFGQIDLPTKNPFLVSFVHFSIESRDPYDLSQKSLER